MPTATVSSKYQPSLLRQLNERQVLATLRAKGPLSRADLARSTGISGPTVTRVVATLIDSGLVEEEGPRQGVVGRPGKIVRLARTSVCVLGAAIGVTYCEMVATGLDGEFDPLASRTFHTPPTYSALIAALAASARDLARERSSTVVQVGLSVPGLINHGEQRSVVSPNLHQLDGRQAGEDLQAALGVPAVVVQESRALCLAEQTYGLAKGLDHFALLDIHDGLGLGVVSGGRPLLGQNGLAGELGHITVQPQGRPCGCGNQGCLETEATDAALAALASVRLGRKLSFDELLALAQNSGHDFSAELSHTLDYLAIGVAAVINIFNPSHLFLHGRMFDLAPDAFAQLEARLGRRSLAPNLADCRIARAQGHKCLGAIAAAIGAFTQGVTDGGM